jgi:pimeloyl-ACP methyl ester carboxylesterase
LSRKKPGAIADDLRGLSRLAVDATRGIVDLIEAVHHNIVSNPITTASGAAGRTTGISAMVYRSVHGVTKVFGNGIDTALGVLAPYLGSMPDRPEREHVQSALNGLLGDHLSASENPLAIRMRLRRDGRTLELDAKALSLSIPEVTGRIVVLVHGLCMNDRQWSRPRGDGVVHDHGMALQNECGYTAVYLHYNTGLAISDNGLQFAGLLETLLAQWPVAIEEFIIVAHSMGGLVSRSALHQARQLDMTWSGQLRRIIFLGTPHHGAPLERGGHWLDLLIGAMPYAAPFARIGRIRSAGITGLRHGHLLENQNEPIPLPKGILCYTIAGLVGAQDATLHAKYVGDGLVPMDSALGRHHDASRHLDFPEDRQAVLAVTNHMQLLSDAGAYQAIKRFTADPALPD